MFPIIALWAYPRTLSTVLERIFIEREDFNVLHEPFSSVYYLGDKRAEAVKANFSPGVESDYASVRNAILETADRGAVFFKDMSYHCLTHLLDDESFLRRLWHVFIIRDPRQSIASHFAINPKVTLEEIGIESQAILFKKVQGLENATPMILEAEQLQSEANVVIARLCKHLGIAHMQNSLRWQKGSRKEWKEWEPWHSEVAESEQVHSRSSSYNDTVDNNDLLANYYSHHKPFYDFLVASKKIY